MNVGVDLYEIKRIKRNERIERSKQRRGLWSQNSTTQQSSPKKATLLGPGKGENGMRRWATHEREREGLEGQERTVLGSTLWLSTRMSAYFRVLV